MHSLACRPFDPPIYVLPIRVEIILVIRCTKSRPNVVHVKTFRSGAAAIRLINQLLIGKGRPIDTEDPSVARQPIDGKHSVADFPVLRVTRVYTYGSVAQYG